MTLAQSQAFPRQLPDGKCPACDQPSLYYVRSFSQLQRVLGTRADGSLLVGPSIEDDPTNDGQFLRCTACGSSWPADVPILIVQPWNLEAIL